MNDQLTIAQMLGAIALAFSTYAGVVIAAIWFSYTKLKEKIEIMGKATDDAITALEGKVQTLGNSILKEVQQLKDAKAAGTDDPAALARLEALGQKAADFTSELDADDDAAAPTT